jgi:hypothetical protein
MKNILFLAIIGLWLVSSTSCKTYKNVENISRNTDRGSIADDLHKLKPGDKIRIKEINGKLTYMKFSSHAEGQITGIGLKDKAGYFVSVNIEEVSQLEAKRINLALTGVSGVLGLTVAAVGVLILAWGAG